MELLVIKGELFIDTEDIGPDAAIILKEDPTYYSRTDHSLYLALKPYTGKKIKITIEEEK